MKELWLEKEPSVVYGGKINQLINLCQLGLSVPKALILPADQVMDWLSAALPEYSKQGLKELIHLGKEEIAERLQQYPLATGVSSFLSEKSSLYRSQQCHLRRRTDHVICWSI